MDLVAIGTVESSLKDRASAPKQGDEGAPDAWLIFDEHLADGLDGIQVGDEILVLTWLDRSRRDILRVHRVAIRPDRSKGYSTHGLRTGRIPSDFIELRSYQLPAGGFASVTSRRWTERRS
jgi:tRNA (Thr-GGU) A37 N-methylase